MKTYSKDLVNPKHNQNWFYVSIKGTTKQSLPSCKPKHPPSEALNLSDSMILKNQGRKKIHKMGSIISKPKEKLQKKEGLIAQMKTKTEVISQFTQITLYCTTLPLPTPHIVNTICCHPVDNNMSIDLSFTKISFILKKNNPEKRKTEGETSTILVLYIRLRVPVRRPPHLHGSPPLLPPGA